MDQETETIEFSYTKWRAGFMRATLIGASILGLPAVGASVIGQPFSAYTLAYIGAYLIFLIIALAPVPYKLRAGTLISLTFGLGIAGLLETGIWGDSRVFMLCAITLASLLFSWKAGWVMTGLSMLSYLVFGWLILNKIMDITNKDVIAGDIGIWTSGSSAVLLFAVLIVNGIRLTQIEFEKAQQRAQNSLTLVREERNNLEQKIDDRTYELQARTAELAQQSQELTSQKQALEIANLYNEQRALKFRAITEISQSIATINTLDELLPTIARIISEKFNYYHTGIFLVDEARQYAVLAASNSAGGQRMLARGHRLEIGKVGIVGNVTATGKPRFALDVGEDAIYFNNPDLPETHSEIALPLLAERQVIGALDVQSTISNAFSQEDIEILSALAGQVSIAIQNARLLETTQKSLAEAEALYRQFVQKEWSQVSRQHKITGYRYNTLGVVPAEAIDQTTMEQIAAQKVFVENREEVSRLAVPITLRGEVIGVLDIQAPSGRYWAQDEIDIAQAIADRVAISAENARLFEQTAERAERERKVSEITSKIRSTNNPTEMMQIALNELKQALNTKNARILPYKPQTGQDQG